MGSKYLGKYSSYFAMKMRLGKAKQHSEATVILLSYVILLIANHHILNMGHIK